MPLANLFHASLHVVSCLTNILQEFLFVNNFQNLFKEKELGRVPNPSVEDAVGLLRSDMRLVEVASREHFLAESDDVRCVVHFPVLMRPKPSSGSTTSLNLVTDEEDIVSRCQFPEAPEEVI